ncbi:beta-N-acetylhexosaminidase [Deinococcus altitudinis]|uniref:beta-N-acetylhexosaminidase n=1 Tax=Deinococcus altitudinis TaxID=468914 RepID=UPI0038924984
MTIQAGHLMMVDLPGLTLDDDTAAHLTTHQIRAVCLFGKNVQDEEQLRRLCRDLREVMGEDALIAIDHEGGAILRTPFWPAPPSAMSLGATDDVALTREVSEALARQLRSVGINWNFAPIMDVNTQSANPVIGVRAFGADPALVTRHALAACAGQAEAGVASCVKHFPGHGDTHQDSHLALPRVDRARSELEATEFVPFRAAVGAGVPAVMTAHIIYSALDNEHPATLSRPVLTGLLRDEWGYDGVIVTDSMGMKAIDDHYGRGEAAVMSLAAGADLVMALGRREAQLATLTSVAAALQDGTFDPDDMERSVRRLSRLARQYPAQAQPDAQRSGDAALFAAAWRRGLVTVGDATPPAPGSRVTLIARQEEARTNVSEAGLPARALARALAPMYDLKVLDYQEATELDWKALREEGRFLLLATAGRHLQPGLTGATPDLHLCLYNAYSMLDVPAPALLSFGAQPEALEAVVEWLRGEVQVSATLPFPVDESRQARAT